MAPTDGSMPQPPARLDILVARGTFGVVGAVIGMGVTGIIAPRRAAPYGAARSSRAATYKDLLEEIPRRARAGGGGDGAARRDARLPGGHPGVGSGEVGEAPSRFARARTAARTSATSATRCGRPLPSHQTLRSQVEPGAEQLANISNTIDAAKIDETFKATTIGRYLSKQGERSVKAQKDAKNAYSATRSSAAGDGEGHHAGFGGAKE